MRSPPKILPAMKKSTGKDENITTAGLISGLRVAKSRRGELWAQASLEDMSGKVELLVFPEAYRKLAEKVKLEVPVLIRGGVRIEEGANPKITANEIIPLDEARVPLAEGAPHTDSAGERERQHGRCAARAFQRAQGRGEGACSMWSGRAISWW